MRTALTFVVAAWIVGSAPAASAQTADEIVEKHLAAMGGRAALGKIVSRASSGTISVSALGADVSGTIETVNRAPNSSRSLIKLDASGFGLATIVIDQRFDGTSGFVLDTFQGDREIAGTQLEGLRSGLFPHLLLNYKERGIAVELTGRERVGDRDALVLTVRAQSGPPIRQYIDAQSYLLVRQVTTITSQGADAEQTTDFQGYQDVDGVQVPVKLHSTSPTQTATIELSSVVHNGPVDEALFAKPAAK